MEVKLNISVINILIRRLPSALLSWVNLSIMLQPWPRSSGCQTPVWALNEMMVSTPFKGEGEQGQKGQSRLCDAYQTR